MNCKNRQARRQGNASLDGFCTFLINRRALLKALYKHKLQQSSTIRSKSMEKFDLLQKSWSCKLYWLINFFLLLFSSDEQLTCFFSGKRRLINRQTFTDVVERLEAYHIL